jgi:hypothetical protein
MCYQLAAAVLSQHRHVRVHFVDTQAAVAPDRLVAMCWLRSGASEVSFFGSLLILFLTVLVVGNHRRDAFSSIRTHRPGCWLASLSAGSILQSHGSRRTVCSVPANASPTPTLAQAEVGLREVFLVDCVASVLLPALGAVPLGPHLLALTGQVPGNVVTVTGSDARHAATQPASDAAADGCDCTTAVARVLGTDSVCVRPPISWLGQSRIRCVPRWAKRYLRNHLSAGSP